jgi:transcriptional regulator with XRE-family HTH domain
MPSNERGAFSIAEKLDRLFQQIRPQGQAEFSYTAVADAIRAQQGISISHTYIWQLRTGRRSNPTVQHLTALALFFGVPVAYFLDDAEARKINDQLDLLRTLRDAQVTEIALRAADVSASSREAISEIVRKVWELENPADHRRSTETGRSAPAPPETPGETPGQTPGQTTPGETPPGETPPRETGS